MMYEVFDRQTGVVVKRYTRLASAARAADRLDNRYGAYRYGYRRVDR